MSELFAPNWSPVLVPSTICYLWAVQVLLDILKLFDRGLLKNYSLLKNGSLFENYSTLKNYPLFVN